MTRLDEARKAAASTKAEASDSAAAVNAPTDPVPSMDASPKQPISSSSPGGLAASSPQAGASPAPRMAASLSRSPSSGSMAIKVKAPVPTPQKGPKAHGVPIVNGGKVDGVSAKLGGQGLSAGTAIVVDGDDDQEEKKNDAPKLGREASSANGDTEGEGNGEASTQRVAKRNALKRPESPGPRTHPTPAVSGPKSPARTHAGRAVEDGDSKVPTKAREGGRKSPGPAVGSPSRKTASPTPPTLVGWMAPASVTSSTGSGGTSKGEPNGSKGNAGGKGGAGKDGGKANGDAEGVEEPAETLTPSSAPAVSPNSRMTRRKSRSLGKDVGEGGK